MNKATQDASLNDIRRQAHKSHKENRHWHFHVLTPGCVLNERQTYAFVLECPDENIYLVHYSDKAERDLGEELAPLAHGQKILDKELSGSYQPSEKMRKIIARATDLNALGVEWHHHVISPSCMFSKS